jgi:multidrug efflux system membrane fusion protein
VDGQLASALFKEGDAVKQGETILKIDPRSFEAALHQAEANLAKDTALATNALVEARREETLFNEKIVAGDVAESARAAAEAAGATAVADQAAVESARLQLSYCTIASPINGRAGKLLVNAGNMVKNNDTVLVTLNQTRPIYVDFSVPEQGLSSIREHMASGRLRVEATVPGHETNSSVGELRLIDNTVDMTTGTVPLRASFLNDNETLWPGQFVNVALTLTTRTRWWFVRKPCKSDKGQYPVVKPDLTAEMRPIVVGSRIGEDGHRIWRARR